MKATTWKRKREKRQRGSHTERGSDNLEATTWKRRQLGRDNFEATNWKGREETKTKIQNYKTAIELPQNLALISVGVTQHNPLFIFNTTNWKRQLVALITLPSRPRHPQIFVAAFRRTFLMQRVCSKPITWCISMHHMRASFLIGVMTLFMWCSFTTVYMFIFKRKVYHGCCLPWSCQQDCCLSADDKIWSGQIRSVFF